MTSGGDIENSKASYPKSLIKGDGYFTETWLDTTTSAAQNFSTQQTLVVPLDWVFYLVHYIAIISIVISIICGIAVLILHARSKDCTFWKRRLGERLYVYQAWTDLAFNLCHICDHIIALTSLGNPNRILCNIFAFALFEVIMAMNVVVLLSAISLFLLVRFNRSISFGPYDVGLLLSAYGSPAIPAIAFSALGYFGSSGYW